VKKIHSLAATKQRKLASCYSDLLYFKTFTIITFNNKFHKMSLSFPQPYHWMRGELGTNFFVKPLPFGLPKIKRSVNENLKSDIERVFAFILHF